MYPDSVVHFFLIGTLGMLLGALFFLFLGFRYSGNKIFHVIVFFVAAVGTASYYAMYTGIGVMNKTNDAPPRLIFWARFVDWIITTPLILLCLALLAKANMSTTVSLIGNNILMVVVSFVGAMVLAPYKYIWWTAGMVFFAIVVVQLLIQLNEAQRTLSPGAADTLKTLTILTCLCWSVYPVVWVLGSEGIDTMKLPVEVGILCIADWISKVGFGGFLLMQFDSFEEGADVSGTMGETTKMLRPTSELV